MWFWTTPWWELTLITWIATALLILMVRAKGGKCGLVSNIIIKWLFYNIFNINYWVPPCNIFHCKMILHSATMYSLPQTYLRYNLQNHPIYCLHCLLQRSWKGIYSFHIVHLSLHLSFHPSVDGIGCALYQNTCRIHFILPIWSTNFRRCVKC